MFVNQFLGSARPPMDKPWTHMLIVAVATFPAPLTCQERASRNYVIMGSSFSLNVDYQGIVHNINCRSREVAVVKRAVLDALGLSLAEDEFALVDNTGAMVNGLATEEDARLLYVRTPLGKSNCWCWSSQDYNTGFTRR